MKFLPGLVACLCCVVACASDWTAFRGGAGDGHSAAKNLPSEWSQEKNIAWKIELPGAANGSPIIAGDRVLLTSATDKGTTRTLHCFSAADGSEQWKTDVTYDREMPTHKTNLYGGTTPASDGKVVVVWHGSAGLYCYDLNGKQLWGRELGEFRHQWGYGTSPVIAGDRVILHSGPGRSIWVGAFRLSDGQPLWKQEEPVENDGETNDDGKYMGSWSTPVLVKTNAGTLAVCSLSTRVLAYDVKDGTIAWTCDGLRGERGDLAYTSPVIAGNVCICMGGYQGPAIGFPMTGKGNITQNRLWRVDRGNPQRIGSGVVVEGLIYMANAGPGTLECIDPNDGSQKWETRGTGNYWSSVVYADGKLFATDQNGTTTVFQPNGEQFEKIAVNSLNDPGNSTIAVADGAIYLRTFKRLYRISTP